MEPRDSKGLGGDFKQNFDTLRTAAHVLSFPLVLCTTRFGTWGSRYLTVYSLLGWLWPLAFAVLYGPHPRSGDLVLFWLASIPLLLIHRVAGLRRKWLGERCHSNYWGNSWLERGAGLMAQRRARFADCLLAWLAGWMLVGLGSAPLGALVLIAAGAKLLSDSVGFHAIEMRVRQMEDLRIENEFYGELYRDRRG